jgi:Ca2+-binding EF-hand superfamily protein
MDWSLSSQEVKGVLDEFDVDKSGGIDFDEFLTIIETLLRREHPTHQDCVKILRTKPAGRKPLDVIKLTRCT